MYASIFIPISPFREKRFSFSAISTKKDLLFQLFPLHFCVFSLLLTERKSLVKLRYKDAVIHEMQLNVGTRTDFNVGCIINSFDLSFGSEPGFFGEEIIGINNTSVCGIGSSAYV